MNVDIKKCFMCLSTCLTFNSRLSLIREKKSGHVHAWWGMTDSDVLMPCVPSLQPLQKYVHCTIPLSLYVESRLGTAPTGFSSWKSNHNCHRIPVGAIIKLSNVIGSNSDLDIHVLWRILSVILFCKDILNLGAIYWYVNYWNVAVQWC